jgi:hypothetical protein
MNEIFNRILLGSNTLPTSNFIILWKCIWRPDQKGFYHDFIVVLKIDTLCCRCCFEWFLTVCLAISRPCDPTWSSSELVRFDQCSVYNYATTFGYAVASVVGVWLYHKLQPESFQKYFFWSTIGAALCKHSPWKIFNVISEDSKIWIACYFHRQYTAVAIVYCFVCTTCRILLHWIIVDV